MFLQSGIWNIHKDKLNLFDFPLEETEVQKSLLSVFDALLMVQNELQSLLFFPHLFILDENVLLL